MELENFSAKLLFTPEKLRDCEEAPEDIEGDGVQSDIGNSMYLEEKKKNNIPPENERKKTAFLKKMEGKKEKRRRKKDKKADERWLAHGHLPQRSAIKKYIGNSQGWKTMCKIERLGAKAGGYCAKPSDLKKMKEIDSIEEAMDRGFTIIECNGL